METTSTPAPPTVSPVRQEATEVGLHSDVAPPPAGPAYASDSADAEAVATAELFVDVLGDTTLSRAQWHAAMRPVVDDQVWRLLGGCEGCGSVDASWFDVGTRTGGGELTRSAAPVLVYVYVPTSVGGVSVTLTRTGGDAPWLVGRFE